MKQRGVLLHISSLPVPKGIGSLGLSAYKFVDILAKNGQAYWQVLPLNQTGYGDSPYQSFCANCGNPYFIDIDMLVSQGLLGGYNEKYRSGGIQYDKLYEQRYATLRNIDISKINRGQLLEFEHEQKWLDDYALFMALKEHFDSSFDLWDEDIKFRRPSAMAFYREKLASEILWWKVLQFLFFGQWRKLQDYAHSRGVKIIGDMPIYVAYDSSDVWANPSLFQLNDNLIMKKVAGVPPDYFSAIGQLWGNPLYDWDAMELTGFEWWIERIARAHDMFDMVRIDHFRGFASYFSIDFGAENAVKGNWVEGVGYKLFAEFSKRNYNNIIAEDLGLLTPDVTELLEQTGFPNMKVLEFMMGDDTNAHLPQNYDENCICYTGTHDNMTVKEWLQTCTTDEKAKLKSLTKKFSGSMVAKLVKLSYSSKAKISIIPVQDLLELGKSSRMNIPSTASGNWSYRMKLEDLDKLDAKLQVLDSDSSWK